MVDLARIELAPSACHADILPLNYRPLEINSAIDSNSN